jgi:hypothetical protein
MLNRRGKSAACEYLRLKHFYWPKQIVKNIVKSVSAGQIYGFHENKEATVKMRVGTWGNLGKIMRIKNSPLPN